MRNSSIRSHSVMRDIEARLSLPLKSCHTLGMTPFRSHDGHESAVERYTFGMCDIFAQALHALVGGEIVAISTRQFQLDGKTEIYGPDEPAYLVHAGVLVNGMVHDAQTALTPSQFKAFHGNGVHQPIYANATGEDLSEMQAMTADEITLHVGEAHAVAHAIAVERGLLIPASLAV